MKIPIGNPQRLSLGAWILAALLLVVHNGLSLTEVLDPPLPGYPNDIRGHGHVKVWGEMGERGARGVRGGQGLASGG